MAAGFSFDGGPCQVLVHIAYLTRQFAVAQLIIRARDGEMNDAFYRKAGNTYGMKARRF